MDTLPITLTQNTSKQGAIRSGIHQSDDLFMEGRATYSDCICLLCVVWNIIANILSGESEAGINLTKDSIH